METPYAAQPATWTPVRRAQTPSSVVAAALLTWSACVVVIVAALVTAISLLAMDGLWDSFYATDARDMQGLIGLAAAVLVVSAAAACFVAYRGTKGDAWAHVTWSVLSLVAVAVSLMWWSLLVSLLVAATTAVTLALLLTPSARAWPRVSSAAGPRTS